MDINAPETRYIVNNEWVLSVPVPVPWALRLRLAVAASVLHVSSYQ